MRDLISLPVGFQSALEHEISRTLPIELPGDLRLEELGIGTNRLRIFFPEESGAELNGEERGWRTLSDVQNTMAGHFRVELTGDHVIVEVDRNRICRRSALLPRSLPLTRVGVQRSALAGLAERLTHTPVLRGHPLCYTFPADEVDRWLTIDDVISTAQRFSIVENR